MSEREALAAQRAWAAYLRGVESLHRRIETLQAQRHHDILKNTTMYARLKAYESAIEGITQEMVDAVRDALPDVTFDDDGTPHPMPFQQWEDYLTAAADILQTILDAGDSDD